jgi:hypothetical protein
MRKWLITLCSLPLTILAQEPVIDPSQAATDVRPPGIMNTHIYLEPGQLFVREFVIGVDHRITDRFQLGVAFGYRPPRADAPRELDGFEEVAFFSAYMLFPMLNPHATAFLWRMQPAWRFGERRRGLIEAQFFHRRIWFDRTPLEADIGGIQFLADRAERWNIYGLKLLVGGGGPVARIGPNSSLVITGFGGIGYRRKFYRFESWNGVVDLRPIEYLLERGGLGFPSIHLGVRVGVGWFSPRIVDR